MASTYSTSLRIQLIGTGEQSGVWGSTTNSNLGTIIEQAITGVQTITASGASMTLTSLNGVSDQARNAVLIFTGSPSGTFTVTTPAVQKLYTIFNNTSGGYGIVITTGSGSTITIPNGATYSVYCDGTNYYTASNFNAANVNITGGTIDGTTIGATTPSTGNFTTLSATSSATVGTTLSVTGAASVGSLSSVQAIGITSGGTNTNATPTAGAVAYGDGVRYQFTTVGTSGQVLTSSGSGAPTWAPASGSSAGGAVYENSQVITANYTMTTGKNGESVGPITINGGVTVTIPTGSTWLVL